MYTVHPRPRILFTTPKLRHPAIGGPYLRIENSIKALSQISELTIYCRAGITNPEIEYFQQFCKEFRCEPPPGFFDQQVTRIKGVVNFFSRKSIKRDIFQKETEVRAFLDFANTVHPDLIWLGYGNISYPLLKCIKKKSDYKVVCDTDSVWSRFLLRGLPYIENEDERERIMREGKEKEEEERWGTQLADITTAVSEIDAEYYRTFAEKPEQIRIFSNAVDLTDYPPAIEKPENFKNPCIYLAGTFWSHSPMEEAARWVINKVMPELKNKIPGIHCYIVGNGSDTVLKDINDPEITITGQVPSVLPFLCHADVVVVPLKFESGTRFKILEAGACRIPVVSTTLGAEGISITPGVDILIADDPNTFADEIIRLIQNPVYARQIGMRLHELVSQKYDIRTLVREGQAIIYSLMSEDTV